MYKPKEVVLRREIKQARCAIGRTTFSRKDERRSAFFMLTNILGGSGMNSRLNMALRERYGFVYSIGANYLPFSDTGLFVISFGTEPTQIEKCIDLVWAELNKLCNDPLGAKQMSSAREQIIGHMAMAEENNLNFMIMMARNTLDLGRVPTLDETYARIHATTPVKLMELANEVFRENRFSYLRMIPN